MNSEHLDVVKYGKDEKLEKWADKLLADSVGKNKRSTKRDREKMAYENELVSAADLHYYDPTNDWDTLDAPGDILVSPSDVVNFSPSICVDVDDGNIRVSNYSLARRRALMKHVDDEDGWGTDREEYPLPPSDIGERKVCAKCGRSKGLECFSPKKDAKDGKHPWCKPCRKGIVSQARNGD